MPTVTAQGGKGQNGVQTETQGQNVQLWQGPGGETDHQRRHQQGGDGRRGDADSQRKALGQQRRYPAGQRAGQPAVPGGTAWKVSNKPPSTRRCPPIARNTASAMR